LFLVLTSSGGRTDLTSVVFGWVSSCFHLYTIFLFIFQSAKHTSIWVLMFEQPTTNSFTAAGEDPSEGSLCFQDKHCSSDINDFIGCCCQANRADPSALHVHRPMPKPFDVIGSGLAELNQSLIPTRLRPYLPPWTLILLYVNLE
jgi:hypothetical protein